MSCYAFACSEEHDDPILRKISLNRVFLDEEVQKIFLQISEKINNDKRRSEKHKRYFLLMQFLYRTGARIDEVLIIRPAVIAG